MNSTSNQTGCAGHPRWMIVDDNEDFLSLMQNLVARISGTNIECFHSSREAIAAFEAAPELIELVITDLEIPEMSGIDLYRRLHAISPTTKFLLTTSSDILTDEEAAQIGFCGVLHKPFPLAALRSALASVASKTFLNH